MIAEVPGAEQVIKSLEEQIGKPFAKWGYADMGRAGILLAALSLATNQALLEELRAHRAMPFPSTTNINWPITSTQTVVTP